MNGGIGVWGSLAGLILILALTALPLKAVGASAGVHLDDMQPDLHNQSSLQSGAATYMNYCMGCHSLQYSRYERVADDLGIPHDLMSANLVFDPDQKLGALMGNSMDSAAAKRWFGAKPPDLTLVARARGTDWLYTYLRTFYADTGRPWGVNNKVFADVGMPHALVELQGLAECVVAPVDAARDPLTGKDVHEQPCGSLEITQPGELSPEEFDTAVYDLVNFLAYVGEPAALSRQRTGVYVLMFIALFFVFTWLLNREYWKDVH
jgi:ubiquinol-cytochrome c reductase cytochrome b subunit